VTLANGSVQYPAPRLCSLNRADAGQLLLTLLAGSKAGIPRRQHGHPRRLPREDRREDDGVSGDFPVQLATGITSY